MTPDPVSVPTLDYEQLTYEVRDAVATLTLNRPEQRNALSPRLLEELGHSDLSADDHFHFLSLSPRS